MNTRFVITLRQALSQIRRNLVMSFASLLSITAILLILGFFFVILVNVDYMAEGVKDNFDTVQVNLMNSVDREGADRMIAEIAADPGVKSAYYSSKEENLEHWKEKWGDHGNVFDRLPENPLPNSIFITLESVEDGHSVVAMASSLDGVKSITYSQDTADKLISITSVVQVIAIVLIVILILIAVVVVSNTIKLTVLAREKEITIMKYIGATNWFIRGPFLTEGIIIGIVSAALSGGIVAGVYHYIVTKYGLNLALFMSSGLVSESLLMNNLMVIFLAIGISIGSCGSIISMRRFLDT